LLYFLIKNDANLLIIKKKIIKKEQKQLKKNESYVYLKSPKENS